MEQMRQSSWRADKPAFAKATSGKIGFVWVRFDQVSNFIFSL
jgi:hypothetical protein